jgi:hypothetical protein
MALNLSPQDLQQVQNALQQCPNDPDCVDFCEKECQRLMQQQGMQATGIDLKKLASLFLQALLAFLNQSTAQAQQGQQQAKGAATKQTKP